MACRPSGDAGCLGLFGWGSVTRGCPQWVQVSHSSIRGDSSRVYIFNTTTSHGEDGQCDQLLGRRDSTSDFPGAHPGPSGQERAEFSRGVWIRLRGCWCRIHGGEGDARAWRSVCTDTCHA